MTLDEIEIGETYWFVDEEHGGDRILVRALAISREDSIEIEPLFPNDAPWGRALIPDPEKLEPR